MTALPAPRLAAYGVLGLPLAMAALPIYVHVPKYYADHVGLPLATVGVLLLAARALDAVQDPLFGWWSDRRRRAGRGRWIFVTTGSALLAAGMVALFRPPAGWSTAALGAWLLATLVLVYSAYSLVSVSYQAHGAEMSRDRDERTRVTAWREGFALVGVFAAAVMPEVLGFERFALAYIPVLVLAALACVRFSPPAVQATAAPEPPGMRSLAYPFGNPRFRRLAVVFVFNGIAAAIPATLVLFFIEDVVARPDLAGAFLVAYFAAGALGLPAWVRLAARWGKSRAWLAAMALSIAAFVWAFALGPGDARAYAAICVMSGLGLGADLALAPSLLADVIDDDEARGRGRHEGAYFGLWNLATKANLALAAGIALPLLAALGYRAGGGGDVAALAAVYALLPCALKAVAAATLLSARLDTGATP